MDFATLEPFEHGTPGKNIAFYNHVIPSHGTNVHGDFMAHWHPEYEIIYVYEGPVSFTLNDRTQQVESGQALFINPNVIHASIPPAVSHVHYVCVTFGEQFPFSSTLDELYKEYFFPLRLDKQIPSYIAGTCSWQKKMLLVLQNLCKSGLQKSRGCELEWRILLLQFFHIAYTYDVFIPRETGNESSITAVQSAILSVQKHYAETIQISQLARQIGFSTEHFCRIFKSITCKTPLEYINAYRLQKAEYFLTHSTTSISQIAISCGFNDINYFSRYFKKIHAITPSQYRKKYS